MRNYKKELAESADNTDNTDSTDAKDYTKILLASHEGGEVKLMSVRHAHSLSTLNFYSEPKPSL